MFVDVSTLRALSHRLAMGDYPRWVNRADVDSQAMFSAYMQYRAANALSDDATETEWQPEWWGHLHMIHHRVSHVHKNILRPETGGVKGRECTQGACSRCEGGVGGYQLRCYSPFWAKFYNKLKREGPWTAPEPAPGKRNLKQEFRFWVRR